MRSEVKTKAYAKINIGLDIVGKTENGYHLLKSIMQQVDLYDEVTVKRIESGITIDSNNKDIPLDETNLAYKAAKLMIDKYSIGEGVSIYIDKHIPMAAGMAGGSTDGAAVLILMNQLYELNLSEEELCEIGVKLGADIPFCIKGGVALCEGIGEKMTTLTKAPKMYAVIAKPPIGISTKYVYTHLDLPSVKHPDMDAMLDAFAHEDLQAVCDNLGNVLESVSEKENEIISKLKASMLEAGAIGSLMSGSGPTVFGLFDSMESASSAEAIMAKQYPDVFVKAVAMIKE